MRSGCPACHAQAVGEPLSRPEIELPFYGRALFLGAVGSIMAVVFMASTLLALLERGTISFDFWTVVSAAETASWRLKFIAIPVCIFSLWGGLRIYRGMARFPEKFAGARIARTGLALSVLVTFWIVSTIAITVPERLRQRQRGIVAAENAKLYRIYCAELEYKARFNTVAVVLDDLREKLPDPDGSLAEALNGADPRGYQPRSDIAASMPKSKTAKLQGAALRRPANGLADDGPGQGLSFTDYELRLPGADKILGTDDDPRMVNGVIVSPISSNAGSTNADSNP